MNPLFTFFPIIVILFPMLVVLGLLHLYRWYKKRKGFISPLSGHLLRPPGESLRTRIENINEKLNESLFIVSLGPWLIGLSVISMLLSPRKDPGTFQICIAVAIYMGFIGYYVWKIIKLLSERRDLKLGLDGELAVAEELNKLMFDGYHVYHDFPATTFNIDHILVGPGGVFIVETKTRSKRKNKHGKTAYEVTYDGNRINFPGGYDTDSLTQARNQGKWLEKWLSTAVGDRIHVEPIVTIPGWFVKRIKPEGIAVLNPKEIRDYIASKKNFLSETQIKRIVHQVDQRCRSIEPYTP